MTRGILIAGNESSLFAAVSAEAAKRVESFAAAVIPNRFPLPDGGGVAVQKPEIASGAISLSWNPASSISARTLVLAAENRLGQVNNAIIICSPPAVFKTAETLMPDEIDILVNDHIRGWFFLIRELVLYFRRTNSGSLSLVAPEEITPGGSMNAWSRDASAKNARNRNSQTDLLGLSAAASFRAFAQGVLNSNPNDSFQTMGFTGCEAGTEADFAAWLFKIIDEGAEKNSGRWHRNTKRKFFL